MTGFFNQIDFLNQIICLCQHIHCKYSLIIVHRYEAKHNVSYLTGASSCPSSQLTVCAIHSWTVPNTDQSQLVG